MQFLKKILIFLLLMISFILPSFAEDEIEIPSATGVVRSIVSENINDNGMEGVKQIIDLEILSGKFKGEKRVIENVIGGNPYYDINLKKGDKVVVHLEAKNDFVVDADDVDFFITDIKRDNVLWGLFGIFALFLVLIGRINGARALVSIVATLALVMVIMVPLILHGINPIISALLAGILSTIVTIYLVAGINRKSSSAILGTVISLILACVMSLLVIKIARLTGFVSEHNMFLHSFRPDLNMQGILASAIILSALGALMDVGVSIASTINELHVTNLDLTPSQLFKSGMNVGRDIIGTMSNTLILVYLGSSLPLVLLSSNIDLQKFFNLNQVATEISSALIGSIAILACVPITALISIYLIPKTKKFTNLNEQ